MKSIPTSKIAKVTATILAITPILLTWNVNSAQAALDSQAIERVNSLSLSTNNNTTQPQQSNTNRIANNQRARSNKFLQRGIEAQAAGIPDLALKYYAEAVTIDPENAHAWLWTGTLLGKTPMGIKAIKLSALLFQIQEDSEGFETAIAWLQEFGVND